MIAAISKWVDDHINAVVQHMLLNGAWHAALGVLFGLWLGGFYGNIIGAVAAVMWNSSREMRDLQKGSGFGMMTLIVPDAFTILLTVVLANTWFQH